MQATGQDILNVARPHAEANDPYVFGAMKPVADFASHKPSDCSKFASCCIYGASGLIYGCDNDGGDPWHCYGGTIYWQRDALKLGIRINVEQAAAIPGAAVLRFVAGEASHHIVISDGQGGTIEAACTDAGVIFGTLHNRRWSTGILVPGINYGPRPAAIPVQAPVAVYRLTTPLLRGQAIFDLQCRLNHLGYLENDQTDWAYGPQTAAAVLEFQQKHGGLVADGEAGPQTLKALGLLP